MIPEAILELDRHAHTIVYHRPTAQAKAPLSEELVRAIALSRAILFSFLFFIFPWIMLHFPLLAPLLSKSDPLGFLVNFEIFPRLHCSEIRHGQI